MLPKATTDMGNNNTFNTCWKSGFGCLYHKQPIYRLDYSRHSNCTAIYEALSNNEESKRQSCPSAQN